MRVRKGFNKAKQPIASKLALSCLRRYVLMDMQFKTQKMVAILLTMLWQTDVIACEELPEKFVIGANLAVEVVEEQSLKVVMEFKDHGVPQVPFGHLNEVWVRIKTAIDSSDQLVKFSVPEGASSTLSGSAGYAVLHSGCIKEIMFTSIN